MYIEKNAHNFNKLLIYYHNFGFMTLKEHIKINPNHIVVDIDDNDEYLLLYKYT